MSYKDFSAFYSDVKLGKKCGNQYQCSDEYHSIHKRMECRDGLCQCIENLEIKYNRNLQPSCGGLMDIYSWISSNCQKEKCPENAECVSTEKHYRSVCRCKEGFISLDQKCIKASYANVLERCYVKGSEAITCNITEHSVCSDGLCICFENYHPNTTSGKCEPLSNYLQSQNLTVYEGRPEEYCRGDSYCISGLVCRSHKCQCPWPCTYKKEQEICDCGAIERPSLVGPIIVGIIIGIIIMVFWACMVKKTIKKYAKKKAASFTNFERISNNQENTDSYALSPVTSRAVSSPEHRPLTPSALSNTELRPVTPSALSNTEFRPVTPSAFPSTEPRPVTPNTFSNTTPHVGLSVPSNETGGQAPVSNDTLPYKPPGVDTFSGPPPPPLASLYDINPPVAPSAPPCYSETPHATDILPPYSLNPVPSDSAATSLPYPANPGNLPYPVSSSVPYSSSASPGAPSYPLNPYGTSAPPHPTDS
ncbi:uncharacterized protein LOC135203757 isoform X2 [Macrobrachium nipponense]|uniref:uncharacterized protein LOC135203757 isoform X2 n=1 Tax=Macrobrachium nipponense TaxID=159736 RepID=UPI0030C84A41